MYYLIILSLLIILKITLILYLRFHYCKVLQKKLKYRTGYGYIYFYRGKYELSNLPLVKIGRTNSMKQRMSAAKTSNPFGIDLLGVLIVKNDVIAETYIHNKFKLFRVNKNNEWFWFLPVAFFMYCVIDYKLTNKIRNEINGKKSSKRIQDASNIKKRPYRKNTKLA